MTWLEFREPVSAWTHFVWMVMSLPATWILWRLARDSVLKRMSVLVFGGTLTLCFGGSFLYHAVPESIVTPFHALDHIGIYLFIAGTVTPIGLVVLRGWWRVTLLLVIWMMALTGIGVRLGGELSVPAATIFYLTMGWFGCLTYFELARRMSHATIRPIWLGGLFYTIGAIINATHWPVLVPGFFESHELFHLFVMAGSAWHYYFMLVAVVAYQADDELSSAQSSGIIPAVSAPRREGALTAALRRG